MTGGGTKWHPYSYRTATSTADAEPERCPKCSKADVYTVFDNVKPEEPTTPSVYKLCGDCDHRWSAE